MSAFLFLWRAATPVDIGPEGEAFGVRWARRDVHALHGDAGWAIGERLAPVPVASPLAPTAEPTPISPTRRTFIFRGAQSRSFGWWVFVEDGLDVEVALRIFEGAKDAHAKGVSAERARVIRCRNTCLTKVRGNDEAMAALARFDGMLLRGEDPEAVKPGLCGAPSGLPGVTCTRTGGHEGDHRVDFLTGQTVKWEAAR